MGFVCEDHKLQIQDECLFEQHEIHQCAFDMVSENYSAVGYAGKGYVRMPCPYVMLEQN